MYILLILFFVSLIGIIIMIGRKLAVIADGQIVEKDYDHPFVPHLRKVKHLTFTNIKKYGHLSLVEILRFHFRSSNVLKNKYEEVKTKIKNVNKKNQANGKAGEKVEVSKFLKMMSDYKQKIREIRHKIKEEENNL